MAKKRHVQRNATRITGGSKKPVSEARKTATIYATPEETASAKLYQLSAVARHRAANSGGAVPPLKGTPLTLSKYDSDRADSEIPEGPILPKRTGRPHGSFYSAKADKEAWLELISGGTSSLGDSEYERRKAQVRGVSAQTAKDKLKATRKTATIYATPEEVALDRVYQTSRVKSHRSVSKGGSPLPLEGKNLPTSNYDESRGYVVPEGPLLPPRKSRPHGSFYSEKADNAAYQIISRGSSISSQFTGD